METKALNTDGLIRLSLMGGQARAFLLDSTHMVEKARQIHSLSRTATAALGRTLTLTSVLGCMLKGKDESVTCRIDGGGPLGLIMAVGDALGNVKGFVANPGAEVPRRGEKLDVGAAVGKNGMLTVIKDMRLKEPYIGQTRLVSGEIGEDFAMYFTASEQTPSLVSVGVLVGDTVQAAGGLVIQVMPGASDIAIRSIEASAGMFMNISKSILDDGLDGTLEQLLSHLEPELLSRQSIGYVCDCSRERVERALMSLGEAELTDMINTQHGAEVDCHFCNTRRRFTEADLRAIIDRIRVLKEQASDTNN